ncbi:MAG TPA: hypothetical protein VFX61_05750 [Micromonosporaceae bacterium]|nr:hypothetical protein [Micromonosporaceae bacterium]
MSVHRGGMRVAAAAVLILMVTGCSIGDIRRPVPTPPGSSGPTPGRAELVGPDEIRHVTVAVPADYQQKFVEFVDARRGYVLFTPCTSEPQGVILAAECPAVLLVTSDGGRSWKELRHPRPMAEFHDQMLVQGERLLLSAGPKHLYHSGDGGHSFTRVPTTRESLPPVYDSFLGRFQISSATDGSVRVIEFVGERQRPLPNQPPVRGLVRVTGGEGRAPLWALGIHQG